MGRLIQRQTLPHTFLNWFYTKCSVWDKLAAKKETVLPGLAVGVLVGGEFEHDEGQGGKIRKGNEKNSVS